MKKCIWVICTIILLVPLTACGSKITSNNVTVKQNSAWTFVDYFDSEDLPWGGTIEKDVPEFMQTTQFQWSDSQFIAIKDNIKTALITGMPIWNVFVTDLNHDGMPEFCATASFGSGVVDNRVIVVDYANNNTYDISDRMTYDFHLSKQDEELLIMRTLYPYEMQKNNDYLTGKLSVNNQQLLIAYTNGETQTVTANNPTK